MQSHPGSTGACGAGGQAGRPSCLGCTPSSRPRSTPAAQARAFAPGERRRCLGTARARSQEKNNPPCSATRKGGWAVAGLCWEEKAVFSLHEQEQDGGSGSGSCRCPAVPKVPLQALPQGRPHPVTPCWPQARRGRVQGVPSQCHCDPGGSPRRYSLDLSFTSLVQMFP